MRGGRLRFTVRFERATEAQNAYGEAVQSWALLKSHRVSIEPLKGAEAFQALQVQADTDSRILCRYCSTLADLSPKDRIVYQGTSPETVYDIKSVVKLNNIGRELEITVRKHD